MRILWRRFRAEGKISPDSIEPATLEGLCAHPINFIAGGPETVARKLIELHRQAPFDVANVEVRWDGLSHVDICRSLERLMTRVVPLIQP
ncbi:MAG TPA: hypothetical protein VLJ39_19970, partial [Tepidisphaeraceae bacterium]|nr:hypothetical protein [Tepidisphaeraceae bacterium]